MMQRFTVHGIHDDDWYVRASEADARIAELERERDGLKVDAANHTREREGWYERVNELERAERNAHYREDKAFQWLRKCETVVEAAQELQSNLSEDPEFRDVVTSSHFASLRDALAEYDES